MWLQCHRKLKSLRDWLKHLKNSTKEAFMVDFGHVTSSDCYHGIGFTEILKKSANPSELSIKACSVKAAFVSRH